MTDRELYPRLRHIPGGTSVPDPGLTQQGQNREARWLGTGRQDKMGYTDQWKGTQLPGSPQLAVYPGSLNPSQAPPPLSNETRRCPSWGRSS